MSLPFDNPTLRRLWDHWQSVRAGRPAPRFDEVSLQELGSAADFVLVVERQGPRFRYLSVGAAIRRIYGYPMEGLFLDTALPPARLGPAIERYARVCDSFRPALARNTYEIAAHLSFHVERLILPLAQDNGSVGGVICGQVMHAASAGAPSGPDTERFEFLGAGPPPAADVFRAV